MASSSACAKAVADYLKESASSRTLNELRDWWTKECKGDAGVLKDTLAELLKLELVAARNVGGVKCVDLASDAGRPIKGSPIVRADALPPVPALPRDASPAPARTWLPGIESPKDRQARLERAADRTFTPEALRKAKLGRVESLPFGQATAPTPANPRPLADLNKGRGQGAVRDLVDTARGLGVDLEVSTPAAAPSPANPPPLPPVSTTAPSPTSSSPPILNVDAAGRSRDNAALPAPPDQATASPAAPGQVRPERAGSVAPSPAAPAQSTVTSWLTSEEVGKMLGIKATSVSTVLSRDTPIPVRRKVAPGRGGPRLYALEDVARVVDLRASAAPQVGTFRSALAKEQPRIGPTSSWTALRRQELEEHQREVADAGLPAIRVSVAAGSLDPRHLTIEIGVRARALLERLLETGLYGADVEEVARHLLLAELRLHAAVPEALKAARVAK